MVHVILGAFA